MCSHYRDAPFRNGGKAGSEEDEDTFDTSTPPVFTELLIRMIEELSDDIVSWSIAGDSFIIKQVSEKRQARMLSFAKGNTAPSLVVACSSREKQRICSRKFNVIFRS